MSVSGDCSIGDGPSGDLDKVGRSKVILNVEVG